MATVNLQDMLKAHEDEEVAVLPAGEYQLEVVRAIVRPSAKGEGILPTFKVIGGPYNGKTVMAGGLYLTDASRSIFFRNLKGFGIDKTFVAQCSGLQDIANALVGRILKVQLEVGKWKNEDKNEVPIGGYELVSIASGAPAGIPVAQAAQPAVTAPAQVLPPPPPPVAAATDAGF